MHPAVRPALRYLAAVVAANLAWEALQLPLYAIWREGSPGEILFALAHCTAGDALIAAASLLLAVFLFGGRDWSVRLRGVAVATILFAVAYTAYSEWLNVSVRGSWAYSRWMPVIFGIGLAPLLQWVATPALGFWVLARAR